MNRLSLLVVFAHPDDEAYGSAGAMAKYSREGVQVSLISATRGEAGEISDMALASPANLGEVREAELRRACALVGVRNIRFLDCPDGAVSACRREETVAKIVAAIREWRPQVVITFGPEGIYGHPDHVAVHELTVAACDVAGDPSLVTQEPNWAPFSPQKVYFRVLPRHLMPRLENEFRAIRTALVLPDADMADFFVQEDAITTAIDVAAYAEIKLRAIAAHRTQVGEEPFPRQSDTEIREELGCEYYSRRGTRRQPGQPYETDLFAGIR